MLKLLIVDDEAWAIAGLQTIIDWKAYGFTLGDCCSCGEDAFASILKNKPDVIFTDIRMPDITGIQLIARIREAGMDIPVVIISAYSDFEVACEAIRYGAYQYLLKPLEKEKVAEIASALGKKLMASPHDRYLVDFGFTLSQNPSVADMEIYLAEHYWEDISLKELSSRFFLSETYLCDFFKGQTGTTILTFLRNIRLHVAAEKLRDPRQGLCAVAESVGYKDYSYFGKLFKARFSLTPEEYRRHLKPLQY